MVFVVGCQKANLEQEIEPQNEQNIVRKQQAEDLLTKVGTLSITKSGINAPYAVIANTTTIKDEVGNPVYHIVNYTPCGFVILAADDRIAPILAYSQIGEFYMTSDINPGLAGWMEDEKEHVKHVRVSNVVQTDQVAAQWEPESISLTLGINEIPINGVDPDGGYRPEPCYCSKYTIDPLLSNIINWDQWAPYNNNTPVVSNGKGSMVHAPAGCVPVAMGQIMAYHEYPKVLTNMSVIAAMLVEIGGLVSIDYNYNGSGAYENKIAPTFKNKFGYKSADYATYNYEVVMTNLRMKKPVIICGGKANKRHAWVSDGAEGYFFCPKHGSYSINFLYMNWGWGGRENGYYGYSEDSPQGHDYSANRKMITNIAPR